MYDYYRIYKSDAPWIRYLVLYLFIVETANTGINMYYIYQPLILRFGTPEATIYFPSLFPFQPFLVVAVSTPIQLFFAWRIRLFTKSDYLFVIVSLFTLTSLAGGVWTGCRIFQLKYFSEKPSLHTPALVWFLCSCVADVLITAVLVVSLYKSKTGFAQTDGIIGKIIRMAVQTGLLTAISAVGDVVTFMVIQHAAVNFLWDLALAKLYANCLLANLNARAGWKEGTSASCNRYSANSRRRTNDTFAEVSRVVPMFYNPSSGQSLEYVQDVEYGITVTRVVEMVDDQSSDLKINH